MRIIAGTKRGTKLAGPKTFDSRPILDRVKESLFSVLYKYGLLEGQRVADVFSGVGSMGLEALSRGAAEVTFIEKDPRTIKVLKSNIEKTGFAKQAKIVRADAFKIGAPVGFEEDKYSVVFIDPPYPLTRDVGEGSGLSRLLEVVTEQITGDGIVVVRTHKASELLEAYGRLEIVERRKWGNMAITILRQVGNDE